ncbi:SctK family type III secretion system sorting platform protein [Sulfidibacter corallicola]|uniref:SctK family type III secretion system sorting platform protein n=1 Tax=Sulfidibacter corallicola TaxID=2818388 RepID=A0A8A4TNX3_SULCO|nr:SctK family type III secretion system sorting platform protein [Sulfidibacter corallicola]QTD51127.1 SctK family type III secretion system sorting platform protein [Sulfidibacter corallicola]
MRKSYLGYLLQKRDDTLMPLVYAFNMLPTRYIHASWVEELLPSNLYGMLRDNPRTEQRLADTILNRLDLKDQFWFDFEQPHRRLALIDADDLINAAYYAGIALNGPSIAAAISRQDVLFVRESIGEESYQFAIKKAPFLVGRWPLRLPDQVGFDFDAHVRNCGMLALAACFADEPPALIQRLQLKFPKGKGLKLYKNPWAKEKDRARRMFHKILIHEVAPQWAALFN